jgi:hypothetical protein
MSIEEHVFRPLRYLAETKRAIPWLWQEIDRVRSHRNWPEWCFLPTGVLSRILSSKPHCHADGCKPDIVAALAAWRATQGIYRFDEDLFRAVWTTSLDSQIPAEILLRMPEWSVYIVTHGCTVGNENLFGFFAHLDFLPLGNHPELRIVLDLGGTHLCSLLPIDLTTVSIEDALETTRQRMLRELAGFVDTPKLSQFAAVNLREYSEMMGSLVNLLLYISSINSEICGRAGIQPGRPQTKLTRHGPRLFSPSEPNEWRVGYRLGAALRAASKIEHHPLPGSHGRRFEPCPHIRRAHWHSYWIGPRKAPESQQVCLKWLPPIPVNVQSDIGIIPVLREVRIKQ